MNSPINSSMHGSHLGEGGPDVATGPPALTLRDHWKSANSVVGVALKLSHGSGIAVENLSARSWARNVLPKK